MKMKVGLALPTIAVLIILSATLIPTLLVVANSTELVINGSFEQPIIDGGGPYPWADIFHSDAINGWTVEPAYSTYKTFLEFWGPPAIAFDGAQCVELDVFYMGCLDRNVKIYQDLDTQPDFIYRVKWSWYERNPGCDNQLEVWWDGAYKETLQADAFQTWYSEERTWAASGYTTRLMFVQKGIGDGSGNVLDAVSVVALTRLVEIDIKPGSYPNSINPDANGVIPIAILTTAEFDASTVDPETVALEGANARGKGKSGIYGSMEDVDGDGDLDLVVQIVNEVNWDVNAMEARLTGMTWDGHPILGMDSVSFVPSS